MSDKPIVGYWKFVIGRIRHSSQRRAGFTLVELLVVILILASLLLISLNFLNPVKQLNKFYDGKRQEDIIQIKTTLDTYYNDHSCYPTFLNFGNPWIENGVTYMRKIPQDPECGSDPKKCYVYQYTGSCPQWTVVFAKLTKSTPNACPLSSLSNCVPKDFDSTWSCAISGTANCSYISTVTLDDGSVGSPVTPFPTNPITPTAAPTPTPTSTCSPKNYACTGNPARCNIVPAGTGTYCTINCDGAC